MEETGQGGPLTLAAYLMGRDTLYRSELTKEVVENARHLIAQVNGLLKDLGISVFRVSSGWRPWSINKRVGGAKGSLHLFARAVDGYDIDGSLAKKISKAPELLLKHGLWMEDPESTPTWVHLDNGVRTPRHSRIFKV